MTQTTASPATRPSAVVWVTDRHAIVAVTGGNGVISTAEIDRGFNTEPTYLAEVVHAIGDQDRVMIMGSSNARIALEREYVSIEHRPDRLVAVGSLGEIDGPNLVARLQHLAA